MEPNLDDLFERPRLSKPEGEAGDGLVAKPLLHDPEAVLEEASQEIDQHLRERRERGLFGE